MFLAFNFVLFCVAVASVTSQDHIDNVAFIKLGSYSVNGFHGKDYYIPRLTELTWSHARSFCNSHGMDIVTIDDKDEETAFLNLCKRNYELLTKDNYIGGLATSLKSADSWYWVTSGNRIAYPMKWAPGEPNNYDGKEWCLTLNKHDGEVSMNDHHCDEIAYKFICQQETFGRE